MSASGDGFDVRTLAATYHTGTSLAPHRHSWGQLIFATSGIMLVKTYGAVLFVPPTRAVWLPAGVFHSIVMRGEVSMRTLYIDASRSAPLSALPHVLEISPLLRELILHILAVGMLAPERPEDDRIAGVLIDLMLTARHEDLALPLPRDARAIRIAERWQEMPSDTRDLTELAVEVGASLRTLQRLFPVETGLTLEAWRQKARLVHAATLLANGASVTETAFDCGYKSLAAFAASFGRQFRISPGRYRSGAGTI